MSDLDADGKQRKPESKVLLEEEKQAGENPGLDFQVCFRFFVIREKTFNKIMLSLFVGFRYNLL